MDREYMYTQISKSEIISNTYHWMKHEKGHVTNRIISDFDMLYTHEGNIVYYIDGKTYNTRKGDIIIFTPGSLLSLEALEPSVQFFFHFNISSSENIKLSLNLNDYMLSNKKKSLVEMYAIEAEKCKNQEPTPIFLMYIKLILLHIIQGDNDSDENNNSIIFLDKEESRLPQTVRSTLEHIHQNVDKNISTDELAVRAGFNTAYFSKYFKKYTGFSPTAYSINYRMNYSRHLVVTTNKTLKEISDLTGFSDQFSFSKRFKKHFGQSPSEIRSVNY